MDLVVRGAWPGAWHRIENTPLAAKRFEERGSCGRGTNMHTMRHFYYSTSQGFLPKAVSAVPFKTFLCKIPVHIPKVKISQTVACLYSHRKILSVKIVSLLGCQLVRRYGVELVKIWCKCQNWPALSFWHVEWIKTRTTRIFPCSPKNNLTNSHVRFVSKTTAQPSSLKGKP